MSALPSPEISFNYLGQFDQSLAKETPFEIAEESSGQTISLTGNRQHLLDIVGSVNNGQLYLHWTYSENIHSKKTITKLAEQFIQALQALIAHCQTDAAGGYTPSDFPLALGSLTQTQIDATLGSDRLIEAIYPLSPLQHGLLFHSLYAPEAGDYIVQICYTFKGRLQSENFARAWEAAIDNHPALRTSFATWDEFKQPLQIVRRSAELTLIQQDWRIWSELEQSIHLAEYRKMDRARGFDLSKAPLMRVTLLQMADDTYTCIWTHHHLLLDGWSLPLVLRDVFESYEALNSGSNIQTPSRNIGTITNGATYTLKQRRSYQDYIAWLLQQSSDKAEHFWRQQLQGFTEQTPLGIARISHKTASEARSYDELVLDLSSDLTRMLQNRARQQQLTLNTLIQGAWALLLSHYSGQNDIVFGSVVAGRSAALAKIESMVGLFINTLPVRVHITPEVLLGQSHRGLLTWLKVLQEQLAEIRQYEHVPLVQIQGWSEMPQGATLFESLLIFENYPLEQAQELQADNADQEASLKILDVQSVEQTHYPLTIFALPGKQFRLKVVFDQERIESGEIERMLGHLQSLLEGFTAHLALPNIPGTRSVIPFSPLTSDERRQLLKTWNATQRAFSLDICIHHLFEDQVTSTPEAIALTYNQQQLTYRELDQRANQVAHYLRTLNVGPEVLVGIYMDRSPEILISLLGILKAGGAYVPLDPMYPRERLTFMITESRLSVLLTQQHLLEYLPKHQARVICLDRDHAQIASQSKTSPTVMMLPEHPAYVIYTSGSTGKPKGVQIAHHALTNFLQSMRQQPGISAQDRLLAVTTLSFDIAGLELYLPLIVGAQIILTDPEVTIDGVQLAEHIRVTSATIMQATPATWRLLLETGWIGNPTLTILCGGEALPQQLAKQLLERVATVWNMYGPTETTIWSTTYQVNDSEELISIGHPIANTQAYILDRYLQPVPVGVIGELYLGGMGLARGYLNRADATAERFIPDPFVDATTQVNSIAINFVQEQGKRLYRTGDLARYLPDGRLECLGRIDNQVKVRGFRIELGEIEKVLNQYESIRECTVIVREDIPGNQLLVAYLATQEIVPSVDEVRSYLRKYLPDYMIPSMFIYLQALPLMPNGKLDHRALPAPDASRAAITESFVAARNDIEKVLVGLWSEVLGIERISQNSNIDGEAPPSLSMSSDVNDSNRTNPNRTGGFGIGVNDNFFTLGGHSLTAAQLVSRIGKTLQVKLPLRSLFDAPTVAEMAQALVRYETKTGQVARIAHLRVKITEMSPEEIQMMLHNTRKERDQ